MEIWRDIEDFPNYQVSNKGRIRSSAFTHITLKKLQTNRYGYLCCNLYKGGKYKNCSVHRLVASAFLDKIEGKDTVDHIDRNRQNNCVENLRWANTSEQNLNSKIVPKGSNTGLMNIYHYPRPNRSACYIVSFHRKKLNIRKEFETLEDAIKFRDEMLATTEDRN